MFSKIRAWFCPEGTPQGARKQTGPELTQSLPILRKWQAMRALSSDAAREDAYVQLVANADNEQALANSLRYVLLVHPYALSEQETKELRAFVDDLSRKVGAKDAVTQYLVAIIALAVAIASFLFGILF